LYLAVVVDACSRRVVGWAMVTHLRTELVLEALNMAIWQRRPKQVIHHSDQGTQYTALAFGKRCREAGIRPSMGSVGDCFDNALCESFFATLECELIQRCHFDDPAEARLAIFEFVGRSCELPLTYENKSSTVKENMTNTKTKKGEAPMIRLKKELRFFEKSRAKLLKEHENEVVLIKGEKVFGFFKNERDAYAEGVTQFGNAAFLIKRVSKEKDETAYFPALTFGLIHADPQ